MKYGLSAIALFAVAAFAVAPAGAYPGPTKMVTYKAAAMKMRGKAVKGYCWTTSLASVRSDAFRCMVGNDIMDPCFTASSKTVNCPQNAIANIGVTIILTKPLPKSSGLKSTAEPWTYQLAGGSGIICNAGTGTVIANYPYNCSGNLVCSIPQASKYPAAYTVSCGTPSGPMTVTGKRTLSIMTAWY